MASYLGDIGEKIADMLGMGKKKFRDVKSGSSSTAKTVGPQKDTDEDIFEKQSQLRKLVDTARKATNKQVR